MSTVPGDLRDLDRYLDAEGIPTVGIVGDVSHTGGYHLGSDRLRPNDYSARTPRDRAGLDRNASGIDIGRHAGLIDLGRELLASCRAGAPGARDVRELIAERGDGSHLWRWDRESGVVTGKPASAELYHHLHVSYYRDSRARDKRPLFESVLHPEELDMITVYSTGGASRTFDTGTPVYSSPAGPKVGEISDPNVVYRIVAEARLEGGGRWWLLDGGGEGDPMRWVLAS